MKKAGILITISGLIILVSSVFDLFGEKSLPLQLTVTGFISGMVGSFSGPAIALFGLNEKRRKKIAFRALMLSIVLVLLGFFCMYFHLPGARVEFILGILIFCFFYGTLAFKNKYEKWKIYTRSKRDAFFLSLFDFLGFGFLLLGFMFKIQYWPLADLMTTIGLIVIVIGMFAWNQKFKREVVFRKQTEDKLKDSFVEIESQHQKLEEKQKEILDSINYAKRIQYALLAHEDLLRQNLPEYFVLFKPKDIVSGDFYWATKKDNSFYLAVCDSTGHGVPGAFMSLLNISFLNEAINEKNILRPDEVLNHVRKRLIQNMESSNDGMDAVLVMFENNNVEYAAAMNAPLQIRNKKVIELPKDKMPVGKGQSDVSFTSHSIEVMKGDILYFYTDGFADQFGGEKGKKFKSKQLLAKLGSISEFPMDLQKTELDKTFEEWKGELEQIDDVCVIGIRI
jgi:serine phosphatase RsbU (regulator of sigma subunit)